MIISTRHRYIFVHIPKTGGTSLATALEDRIGPDDISIGDTPKALKRRKRLDGIETAGRLWKHSTLSDISGLLSVEEAAEMRVFTIVRNPWDRLISYFHWLRQQSFAHPAVTLAKTHDFSDFLRHPQTRDSISENPYRRYVTDADGKEKCAMFLRFETLEQDFRALSEMLDIKLGTLPHLNASTHEPYRDAYSNADREIVAQIAAEDIERFDYQF